MSAGPFRDFMTEFAAVTPEKTYRASRGLMARLGGEDAQQVTVIIGRGIEGVMLPLPVVVLAQSHLDFGQVCFTSPGVVGRGLPGDLFHKLVYIFQLTKSGPALVAFPPL